MSSKTALWGLGALALTLGLTVGSAPAQDMTAEIKTWSGQAWRLEQSSLEVFYTISVAKDDPQQQQATTGAGTGPSVSIYGSAFGSQGGGRGIQGSLFAEARGYDQGSPDAFQGRRRRDYVTVYWAGTEIQVPVDRIASLLFRRQPVADSTLPPYVTGTHHRHAVTAVLTDGARIEGDYINMGTTILRGTAPQGRVDIPWDDIESVRFTR